MLHNTCIISHKSGDVNSFVNFREFKQTIAKKIGRFVQGVRQNPLTNPTKRGMMEPSITEVSCMRYPYPKIDLHLHLDGSFLPETAWELARAQGVPMPAQTLEDFRHFLVVSADCRSVNDYLQRFELPLQLMQRADNIARVTRELIELLDSQGLAYAEIRFAPQLHTRSGLSQRDAVEAVLAGRQAARVERIHTGILLCAMCIGPETANEKENLETVELAAEYLGRGVVGFDLAGAEGIVPLRNFAPVFDRARALQLPLTCHAGDSQGPDTVQDALDFGVSRIGHGHHIFDDPALCRRAIDQGVTLEICPTSNIQCQTQPSYREHPAKRLLDMGMKITINTDNMILSGIDLDHEYDRCLKDMGFAPRDILTMLRNSAECSFAPPEVKAELLAALDRCPIV